jgi:diaminohydroxyphosphoribosylaminopyrimidine deaminase / 5-amino-6-(5-phosphoribosylamino)uracil reductase
MQNLDTKYMKIAIKLAQKGIGQTNPNPPVGAVIVKNRQVIAKNFHKKVGSEHAEILAIKEAGTEARGADIYITLEPCSSYGKTPPCVEAIIKAGIQRVFIGSVDPNKVNQQKAGGILQQHDIQVQYGVLQSETDKLIEVFTTFIEKKRPFFVFKTAMSLDGRIALQNGCSKWISSEKSRKFVHQLRSQSDAILVGKNTLLVDNPHLDVRYVRSKRMPYKLVLGFDERINFSFNIFKKNKQKVMFFTQKDVFGQQPFNVQKIGSLIELAAKLYELNVMSVLVEGGAKVYQSFLDAGLIDKFCFFVAPIIMGGDKLAVPINLQSPAVLQDCLHLINLKVKKIAGDIFIEGYPERV